MNKSIMKKVVSVITCMSILAGVASVSNAYSINSGSSASVGSKYATDGYHGYEYQVSYILFSGMAAGSYASGLYFKVDSNLICEINTSHKKSNYQAFGSKTHYYTLNNTSGKHVSVTFSKLQY